MLEISREGLRAIEEHGRRDYPDECCGILLGIANGADARVESVRDASGVGITVSYWASLPEIAAWKRHGEHLVAQQRGRAEFYTDFRLRIAIVESESALSRPS